MLPITKSCATGPWAAWHERIAELLQTVHAAAIKTACACLNMTLTSDAMPYKGSGLT